MLRRVQVLFVTTVPAARWLSHIQYLASDELAGRETGSEGHRRAAEYIADAFKRTGLKPDRTEGYFQPVKFISRKILEEQSSLVIIAIAALGGGWLAGQCDIRACSRNHAPPPFR